MALAPTSNCRAAGGHNRLPKSGAGGLAHLVVCEPQVASHTASGLASPLLTEFARALC